MRSNKYNSVRLFICLICFISSPLFGNDAPVVTDVPDETIAEGGTFTTISLNDYVSDTETVDADIVWTYSGNSNLTVSITSQVATITTPVHENENQSLWLFLLDI